LAEAGKADGFVTRAELLFKLIDGEERMVVPRPMHSQIIKRIHDEKHLLTTKTEQIIRRDYWLQDLKVRVEKVVRKEAW